MDSEGKGTTATVRHRLPSLPAAASSGALRWSFLNWDPLIAERLCTSHPSTTAQPTHDPTQRFSCGVSLE